jgi:hypothetical protein
MLEPSDVSTVWHLGQFTLFRINVSSDYKEDFKRLKFLIAWAGNVRFAHTHAERRGPLIKYVFNPSSRNFDSGHKILFWNSQRRPSMGNAAHLLLASMMSVAMPQTSRGLLLQQCCYMLIGEGGERIPPPPQYRSFPLPQASYSFSHNSKNYSFHLVCLGIIFFDRFVYKFLITSCAMDVVSWLPGPS